MSFLKKKISKKGTVENDNENKVWPLNILKLDKSDYDATFDIANAGFRMVGIRLTNKDSPSTRFFWNAFFLFEFMNLFVAMLLELAKMFEAPADGTFIDLFTMVPCVGYLILSLVKTYKMFYNRPVYENLITELRDMWPQEPVTDEEHKIVSSELTRLRRIVKGYMFCNIALFIMFASPAFICIVKRKMGYDIPLRLSFAFWFPFDPLKRGRFEVIAVIQTWQCFLTITFITASDILFCVFLSHITTQFDLLAVKIKKLFYMPNDKQFMETYPLDKNNMNYINENLESINSNDLEKTYRENVVEIITRHRALIRLSGDVENQFSFSLLINFMNSSIIICFCGFCCVFVEKWNAINYKLFLTTATLQIWLLCWYGQKLLDSSGGIADAVYCSGWYNVSKNIKNSLIIILYRAKKNVYITTYGYSVISMETYCTILKTAWSYLMLLVNVFKQ